MEAPSPGSGVPPGERMCNKCRAARIEQRSIMCAGDCGTPMTNHNGKTPQAGKSMCRPCRKKRVAARKLQRDEAGPKQRTKAQMAEEWRRIVEDVNGGKMLDEYQGAAQPVAVECAKGHVREVRPADVIYAGSPFCIICDGKFRSVDQMAEVWRGTVEDGGGEMLDEYHGADQPHQVRCAIGHVTTVIPARVIYGGGVVCLPCGGGKYRSRPELAELWRSIVEDVNGGQMLDEFHGTGEWHRVQCAQGHRYTVRPTDILYRGYPFCHSCDGLRKRTAELVEPWRHMVEDIHGGKALEEFHGQSEPHLVECRAGHVRKVNPSGILYGKQGLCAICAGNDPETAERQFHANVKALGGVVRPYGEWLGTQANHPITCAEGHDREIRPHALTSGQGLCAICAGNVWGAGEAAFRSRVAEVGGTCLYDAWGGANTGHKVRCAVGHINYPAPAGVVSRGQGICRTCSGHDGVLACQDFFATARSLGWEVLGQWKKADIKVPVRCSKGHEFDALPRDTVRAAKNKWTGCWECSGLKFGISEDRFLTILAEQGAISLETHWMGSNRPHRIRCRDGHETSPSPGGVLGGVGICRFCAHRRAWDHFYVVTNQADAIVKPGVTSGDPRPRLKDHHAEGYTTVERSISVPDARELEIAVLGALRDAGEVPIRGVEYFDIGSLATILDIVDNWPVAAVATQVEIEATILAYGQLTLFAEAV
jgi:hypothetical protein